MLTLSKKCKAVGFKSALELTRITGVSKETLTNWMKNKPLLFDVVLLGALQKKV